MNGFVKKFGYVALLFAALALVFSSTGCANVQRPGWIIPNR